MNDTCRVLIAGFGRPGMRDLDFGRQVVDWFQQLAWPDGVVVEDLSFAAPLVLHRLQELQPAKVVLLGAVPRGLDPPATLRRYRVDRAPAGPAQVRRSLEESVMGLVDLDHTLAVARHWGGLPVDTTVIEVEPADSTFGLGFSEELAACFDPLLDVVREELAGVAEVSGLHPDFDADELCPQPEAAVETPTVHPPSGEPSEAMTDLLGYARHHSRARLQSLRPPGLCDRLSSEVPTVALAGRVRPWGVFVESGGDWFDAVPLEGGALGIVVGDVPGRGVEVAGEMSDVRAAVRAYAVLDGRSPARMVHQLDRLAQATGIGQGARIVYLVLQPDTGEVRLTNAGSCPSLVLDGAAPGGRFVDAATSEPIGASTGGARPEATMQLGTGFTLLLFTDGLVESGTISRATGMERLRRAAADGPDRLEDLCDHVLTVCTADLRRDDDISLLGVRLLSAAVDELPVERQGDPLLRHRG